MPRRTSVSTSRVIAADRHRLFDIVADPSMHPVIDGSGSVVAVRDEHVERLVFGTRFRMQMRWGASYPVRNVVVEYVAGERIAWRHGHGHRWRYEFTDVDGDVLVTETFDWSSARCGLGLELLGLPRRNLANMRATLVRLEEIAGTASA